jgi:CMP-N-acetylneuraminic acid synthetase
LRDSLKRPLCVIAARGGSQGVPGKNIRPLCGKPVIAWAIEKALAVAEFERVVVSTDDAEIARIGAEAGAEVPFKRPADLAGPDTGKFQVWQHALRECESRFGEQYEAYVDIDCTNPLLEAGDIRAALAQFREGRRRGVDAVFTVCRARRNPYFNLVEPDASGALRMSKRLPGGQVLSRQMAPPVLEHVAGVYVLAPAYLRHSSHLLDGHAEGYEVAEGRNLDIDSEFDFQLIEFLMRRRLESTAAGAR